MYEKWVKEYYEKNESFQRVIAELKNLSGTSVLYYSHDDPDGITSAIIMSYIFKKLKIKFTLKLPPSFELEKWRVDQDTKNKKYEALITTDKGTLGYFNDFTKKFKKVIVIDHHMFQGNPDKTILFNPQEWCSASFLTHMIATILGFRNDYLDFICLIGLKGDWAIQPIVEVNSPFVLPFLKETKKKFKNLFKVIKGKTTWFDTTQREKTVLLNLITEIVHALCGGGFQYFYNGRHKLLQKINQPEFTYKLLWDLQNCKKLTSFKDDEEFFKLFKAADRKIAVIIYRCYLEDFERALDYLNTSAPFMKIKNTVIYLFIGYDIPLIPMIGSVKLYEFMKKDNVKSAAIFMVNFERGGSTHISLRGQEEDIHLGKICSNLAETLVKEYGHKDLITGGGHPVAAELKVRYQGVPYGVVLKKAVDYLNELYNLSKKIKTKDKKLLKKAEKLGLLF